MGNIFSVCYPMGDTVSNKDHPCRNQENWMSSLSDDTSLANISIPGTHDSCSRYGGNLVKCQHWSLDDQYSAGVRFVDIRCRHYNDAFPIHHGKVYQKLDFNDVLDATFRFLGQHPKETVLMRIKEEYKAKGNHRTFSEQLQIYLDRRGRDKFWMVNVVPSLKDVRGKIVLLQDFPGMMMGIFWQEKGALMDIDDHWKVPTILPGSINKKKAYVKNHLEAAKAGRWGKIFVTFSSGSSSGAYPNAVAGRLNPFVKEVCSNRGIYGVVVMDFPGEDLIDVIISDN